jgi:hypothetical protein
MQNETTWDRLIHALSPAYRANVHVASGKLAAVEHKLEALVRQGPGAMHVITDFDMTLTQYHGPDGKRTASSHGILTKSQRTTPEYRELTNALFNKYHPMEVDRTLEHAAKVKAMEEWWTQAHEAILKLRLTRASMLEMVGVESKLYGEELWQ